MSGTVDNAIYQAIVSAPNVFRNVKASAAGNAAIWSPQTGKRFVILGYEINVTSNAAAAAPGILDLTFIDGATNTQILYSCFVPGAAGTTFVDDSTTGYIPLGSGYISLAVGNVLSVNLSFALTSGVVQVQIYGKEI